MWHLESISGIVSGKFESGFRFLFLIIMHMQLASWNRIDAFRVGYCKSDELGFAEFLFLHWDYHPV